ncbi:MAG TPA: group II intron reverse transcriptase/maturase, partial [Candidatus Methylomirabilis sp.]|nr:group II intron reverse transcriptase/maturase [Candidatus Methylomirabilis sp.]
DGVADLAPEERLKLAQILRLRYRASAVRRVYIPKPGKQEKRPLGIPTLRDRATQALMKLSLEPEWEARFEPHSYGFRPGRSAHDAIGAIFHALAKKTAYVLDADISACFDRIDHAALLAKLQIKGRMLGQIRAWLKAGALDGKVYMPAQGGTPQGGVISPLLANIALHGMETDLKVRLFEDLKQHFRQKNRGGNREVIFASLSVIRYADDFVVIHESLDIVMKAKQHVAEWLKSVGLELKPEKTRIVHTMNTLDENPPGFDFLGFNVRHYAKKSGQDRKLLIKPTKKGIQRHRDNLAELLRLLRGATQEQVIQALNPRIRGWANYYRHVVSKQAFSKLDNQLHWVLRRWAKRRHPNKSGDWAFHRYWSYRETRWEFSVGKLALDKHADTEITRHVKVIGARSPFDGDAAYWSERAVRNSRSPLRARLIAKQKNRCVWCRGILYWNDPQERHHLDRDRQNNRLSNLWLVHRHCHDDIHRVGYA